MSKKDNEKESRTVTKETIVVPAGMTRVTIIMPSNMYADLEMWAKREYRDVPQQISTILADALYRHEFAPAYERELNRYQEQEQDIMNARAEALSAQNGGKGAAANDEDDFED